jgi:glycosyltransferase involved in cell wall biosynthesis
MTTSKQERPLRILVANWNDRTDPHAGGAEVHIHEIFKRVAAAGHEVSLLCNRAPGAARAGRLDGMRVLRVGSRNTYNYWVPAAYRRYFRGRVDVVVDALNKLPLMTPLYVREPVVAIVHHLFGATAFQELSSAAAAYVGLFERFVPRVYRDTLIEVISESTREDLHARGVRNDELIRTIFCGLDQEVYRRALPDPEAARSERPLLLFLGRVKRYKAVETLVRALPLVRREMPETRVVIAGDGDDVPRLRGIAAELGFGPQDVVFPGLVSVREKVRLYQSAWAAVMPSPKEGWGLTVVEASACGTPVIAANSPGLRESVLDGRTGLLYPFGDVETLADHALRLLKDPARREEMGRAGAEWSRNFSWEEAARQTVELLREALLRAKEGRGGRG